MPLFTLHRNYTLRTTKGRAFEFKKGVPIWVNPDCISDAIAVGAVPDEKVDVIEPDVAPKRELTPDERQAAMFVAFEKMSAAGNRSDFGANGLPVVKKLEELVGFEMTNRERDAAWMAYKASKAED